MWNGMQHSIHTNVNPQTSDIPLFYWIWTHCLSHTCSHTHIVRNLLVLTDPWALLGGWRGPKSRLIVDHSAICLPFHTNICQEIYHLQCSTIMWHDSKNVYVQTLSVFCRQESICRNEGTAVPSLLTTPPFFWQQLWSFTSVLLLSVTTLVWIKDKCSIFFSEVLLQAPLFEAWFKKLKNSGFEPLNVCFQIYGMFIARHVKGYCPTTQHGQLQSSMEWAVAFGDAAAQMSRSQVRTCTIITAIDENLGYAVMLLRPGAVLLLSIHILTESLRCPTGNSRNKWVEWML